MNARDIEQYERWKRERGDLKVTSPGTPALPPDPDGMNDARAAWADQCLELMSAMTGCEPGQEALGDLICNLFHWGDRNGVGPAAMRRRIESCFHTYQAETGQGVAW